MDHRDGHSTRKSAQQGRFQGRALPAPPVLLARVVSIAGDPDRPLQELGRACSQDPGLTVELLRAANSARHASADPVRSVPHAVVKLGARVVRSLAITYTMRSAVADLNAPGFHTAPFWEDSLRRAAAAALIAERVGYDDPHGAFALGLTQDLGTLVLAAGTPAAAEHLEGLRRRPAKTRIEAERVLTGRDHPSALIESGLMDALPEELIYAVRHHHAPEAGDSRGHQLARIAHAADLLADVVQAFPKSRCIGSAEQALAALGLEGQVAALVDQLAERVTALGAELSVEVGEQPTMASVEAAARTVYAGLVSKAPPPVLKTAPTAGMAPPVRRDRLTGLDTVRAFRQRLVASQGGAFSVLVLDIDHFKRINDAFGLAAGDRVLREVARQLQRVAGDGALAARIGGEEFALLMPGSDARAARRVADHLRRVPAATPIPWQDERLRVTVSVGGASTGAGGDPERTLAAADHALHAAKRSGRDKVLWQGDLPEVQSDAAPPLARAAG